MAGPWEQYQSADTSKPWEKYGGKAAPAPAEKRKPIEITEPEKPPEITMKNVAGAALEPALSMLTGAVAQPVSGIAGILSLPFSDKPEEVIKRVQGAMTYRPRTAGGKKALENISKPFELVHQGGQAAGDWAERHGAPPVVSAALASAPEAALALLGGKGIKGRGESALDRRLTGEKERLHTEESRAGAKTDIQTRARELGMFPEPRSGVRGALAGAAGKARVTDTMSAQHNLAAQQAIKKEHGLDPDEPLTEQALERKRDEYAAPYREVISTAYPKTKVTTETPSKIVSAEGKPFVKTETKEVAGMRQTPGFKTEIGDQLKELEQKIDRDPETWGFMDKSMKLLRQWSKKESIDPADALQSIKALREQSKANFKKDATQGSSKARALAFTQRKVADSLELLIEENARNAGKTGLADRLRDARTKIAKTFDVESALLPDGSIDFNKMRVLGRTKPLSGVMKDIADFARVEKPVTKAGVTTAPPRISFWDFNIGLGSVLAGHPMVGLGEVGFRNLIPELARRGLLSPPPGGPIRPGMGYTGPVAAQQAARSVVPASIPGQLGTPPQGQ